MRWLSSQYDGTSEWGQGYQVGSDRWMFGDSPQANQINYDFMSDDSDFLAMDASGNYFAISGTELRTEAINVSLGVPSGEFLASEDDAVRYTVHGNLFAAPVIDFNNGPIRENKTLVWDVTTGELIAQLPLIGHIRFSPDGSKVAVGRHILELETGEELAFLQADVYSLMIGLQDRILLYGADDSIRLFDGKSLEEIAILPMTASEVRQQSYRANADGSFFLTNSNNLIIRIDGNTGAEIMRFQGDTPRYGYPSIYISPDVQYLLLPQYTGEESIVTILDAYTGEEIVLPENYLPRHPYFYQDSSLIVMDTSSNEVLFYNLSTTSIVKHFPFLSHIEGDELPMILEFSRDNRYMFMGNSMNALVWSAADARVVFRNASPVRDWAFNPDSSLFAFQTQDDVNMVVNLLDGSTLMETAADRNIYFVADRILALEDWNDYEIVTYLNVATGEEVSELVYVERALFEIDELRFFRDETSLRVESSDYRMLANFPLDAYVHSMSMSSDGSQLYMDYIDGRVGIWAVVE